MTPATNTESAPSRSAHRRGIAASVALLAAIAPLGVSVGVALGALSTPPIVAWLSAPLMVAGAAQLVLMGHLDSGSPFLPAALAAIVLNGRFVIYGAALAGRFGATQPGWFRTFGPHYIVDQTYAMTLNDITADDTDADFRRYFMTAGTILWVTWTITVGLGIVLGPVLPPQLPLELVLPASFVALVAPTVARPSELVAALLGAVASMAASTPSVTLAIAALGGMAIGIATARTP